MRQIINVYPYILQILFLNTRVALARLTKACTRDRISQVSNFQLLTARLPLKLDLLVVVVCLFLVFLMVLFISGGSEPI